MTGWAIVFGCFMISWIVGGAIYFGCEKIADALKKIGEG